MIDITTVRIWIEKAKALGYDIVEEDWGSGLAKCCCPMGAPIIGTDGPQAFDRMSDNEKAQRSAELLGVERSDVEHFINGFDGNRLFYIPPAAQLGRDIRLELGFTTLCGQCHEPMPCLCEYLE